MITIDEAKRVNEEIQAAVKALNALVKDASAKGLSVQIATFPLCGMGYEIELVQAVVRVSPDDLE